MVKQKGNKPECLDYQLSGYLKQRKFKIAIAFFHIRHLKKSEGIAFFIDKYIEANISKVQQEQLIKHFDEMTEEERRFPGRLKE